MYTLFAWVILLEREFISNLYLQLRVVQPFIKSALDHSASQLPQSQYNMPFDKS